MKKKFSIHGRWFLENPFYKLANAEEIRDAARKAGVRLVDAQFRTQFDSEAAGKPAEVLLDRYKKQTDSSDSNQSASNNLPEGVSLAEKLAEQRLREIAVAEAQEAENKAAEESARAKAAAEEAAAAQATKDKEAAQAKAAKAAAEAAKAKAEAEAAKTLEAQAEVATKASK